MIRILLILSLGLESELADVAAPESESRLFQREALGAMCMEQPDEAVGEILQLFLLLLVLAPRQVLLVIEDRDTVDSVHVGFERVDALEPEDVLGLSVHQLDTLHDVDDVVDASPLHLQFLAYLVHGH